MHDADSRSLLFLKYDLQAKIIASEKEISRLESLLTKAQGYSEGLKVAFEQMRSTLDRLGVSDKSG